jgi:hypothetical protein
MKKAICILVALLAFTCGVFVFYVRPILVPISLFELRHNASQYKSHKFKVIGKLTVWKADESTYYIGLTDWEGRCSSVNYCGYSLRVSEELIAENETLVRDIAQKNETNIKTDFRSFEHIANVEITGFLVEEEQTEYFPGIYDVIKVEKIKQLSPVKFVLLDDTRQH